MFGLSLKLIAVVFIGLLFPRTSFAQEHILEGQRKLLGIKRII